VSAVGKGRISRIKQTLAAGWIFLFIGIILVEMGNEVNGIVQTNA
jgi:hypothetical protein